MWKLRCTFILTISILVAIMILSGCTTTHFVSGVDLAESNSVLRKGDRVTLVLTDGRRFTGAIAGIDESFVTLVVPEQETARIVAISDIGFVEGRTVSAGKTGGLVATILLVSLILALGSSGGVGFSPGL